MAIKLASKDDVIKIVAKIDSAVTCSAEDYEAYLQSLNEDLLQLSGVPTRFVVRKILPYGAQKDIDAGRVKVQASGEAFVSTQTLDEARAILVGIENPADLEEAEKIKYEKDKDGYASKELIASLAAAGVTDNLINARRYALAHTTGEALKKKS